MSLWTLIQTVLLIANSLAILNEERFLEPKNLTQRSISSGFVQQNSFKGQMIGLIYATSFLRSTFMYRFMCHWTDFLEPSVLIDYLISYLLLLLLLLE